MSARPNSSRKVRTAVCLALLATVLASGCATAPPYCQYRDEDKAVATLRTQACYGSKVALYTLGRAYEQGLYHLPKDRAQAIELYKAAAEPTGGKTYVYVAPVGNQRYGTVMPVDNGPPVPGNRDAVFRLGFLYHTGTFVEKDDKIAAEYLKRAAKRGDKQAQKLLGEIEASKSNAGQER